jgi:hypothetical protein
MDAVGVVGRVGSVKALMPGAGGWARQFKGYQVVGIAVVAQGTWVDILWRYPYLFAVHPPFVKPGRFYGYFLERNLENEVCGYMARLVVGDR